MTTATLVFTLSDGSGATTSATLSLNLNAAPLVITTTSLPDATVGVPYSATLSASGGTPPYTWSATGLPAGLSLSADGVISGTPS